MRVYFPATVADLADEVGLSRRHGHAVTDTLRAQSPGESEDDLEVPAFYAAADASFERLQPSDVTLRVVVSAEVQAAPPVEGSLTEVDAPAVPWSAVVAIHVDDPHDEAAHDLIRAAVAEGDEARTAVDELDLLWFDISERAALLGLISAARA